MQQYSFFENYYVSYLTVTLKAAWRCGWSFFFSSALFQLLKFSVELGKHYLRTLWLMKRCFSSLNLQFFNLDIERKGLQAEVAIIRKNSSLV